MTAHRPALWRYPGRPKSRCLQQLWLNGYHKVDHWEDSGRFLAPFCFHRLGVVVRIIRLNRRLTCKGCWKILGMLQASSSGRQGASSLDLPYPGSPFSAAMMQQHLNGHTAPSASRPPSNLQVRHFSFQRAKRTLKARCIASSMIGLITLHTKEAS